MNLPSVLAQAHVGWASRRASGSKNGVMRCWCHYLSEM